MTCKHCGAAAYREAYNPEFPPPKKWLCGTINGMRSPACYESEIEKLREKKAEGLTWEDFIPEKVIDCKGIYGSWRITDSRTWGGSVHLTAILRSGAVGSFHKTVETAKAHAEELHQQAWRELRARWDFKGGGK